MRDKVKCKIVAAR